MHNAGFVTRAFHCHVTWRANRIIWIFERGKMWRYLTLRHLKIPAATFRLRWTSFASASVTLHETRKHHRKKRGREVTEWSTPALPWLIEWIIAISIHKSDMKYILFFSCHSWSKLGVPHGDVERHGDQFKDRVLLGTGRTANRHGEWGMKRFRILEARPNLQARKCAIYHFTLLLLIA